MTLAVHDEVGRFGRSVSSGALLPQPTQLVTWATRLEAKLRDIYRTLTCTRTSDVVRPQVLHRPPRPSTQQQASQSTQQRQQPRPRLEVEPSPRPSPQPSPRPSPQLTPRPPPPDQAGSSAWQHQQGPTSGYVIHPQGQTSGFLFQPHPQQPHGISIQIQFHLNIE